VKKWLGSWFLLFFFLISSFPVFGQSNTRNGWGWGSNTPALSTVSPNSAPAGGAGFPITVTGKSFCSKCVVLWNGSGRPTKIVSSTQAVVTIYNTDIAQAGQYSVAMRSPLNGTQSNALQFTVAASATQVSIAVAPTSTSLQCGKSQQFTDSVSGTSNSAVTWRASGGSISDGGMYTAPVIPGSYVVTATSVADTSKSASAAVTVNTTVAVTISPGSASLATGGSQQFTAAVSGSSNTAVTWSATGGTVSSSGMYTAPATAGTYTVKATSVADSTKSASAAVTVSTAPVVSVSISPASVSLLTSGTQQFTASVTGSSNTAVTWSATGGTISTGGLYTAPATAGTFTVTATSVADSTKSASAAVTVLAPISIVTTSLPGGTQNVIYSQTLSAIGGTLPYTWAVASGALPAGLSLSISGTIGGTPTQAGQFSFAVKVNDSSSTSRSATQSLTISIASALAPLSITTSSLPSGTVAASYRATLSATGGTTPYNWSIIAGSLPAGLSFSASGAITGIPTQSGQFNFDARVTDSSATAETATGSFILNVGQSGTSLVMVGHTTSTNFPVTNGSTYQGTSQNGALTVLQPGSGSTALDFSTYLGGGSAGTQIRDVWVDPAGDIYVGGTTSDSSFPVTGGVFQGTYGGGPDDAFICRYSATGTKRWCSYLGTAGPQVEEKVYSIAGYDPITGDLTVCGRMNGATSIAGVSQTKIGAAPNNVTHAFVAKIKPDGTALTWFTEVGGSLGAGVRGRCVLDSSGNVYADGLSQDSDFPVTAGAYQSTNKALTAQLCASPYYSGIVFKLNANGAALAWATYIGGSGQAGDGGCSGAPGGIALDTSANPPNVYVAGYTSSGDIFPSSTATGYQKSWTGVASAGGTACWIAKLKSDGTAVLNSTFFNGSTRSNSSSSGFSECDGLTLDSSGNVWVTGQTPYADLPTTAGAYQTAFIGGNYDTYVAKFSPDLSRLLASTFLGGTGNEAGDSSARIEFDSAGNVYTAYTTASTDVPVTSDAYQGAYQGGAHDEVVVGLSSDLTTLVYSTYLGGNGDDFNRSFRLK
jgi:Putative Ig domain/Beta-propeller repeat